MVRVGLLSAILAALFAVSSAFAGFDPQELLTKVSDKSVDTLVKHLDQLRSEYYVVDDIEKTDVQYEREFDYFDAVIKDYQKDPNPCQYPDLETRGNCLAYFIRYNANRAYKDGKIGIIVRDNLRGLSKRLYLDKNGLNTHKPKKDIRFNKKVERIKNRIGEEEQHKEKLNKKLKKVVMKKRKKAQKVYPLPSLINFMSLKNYYQDKRELQSYPRRVDPELLEKMNKLYYRKLEGIGKLSLDEYMYSYYNRIQINRLASILESTINATYSYRGYVILEQVSTRDQKDKIKQLKTEREKIFEERFYDRDRVKQIDREITDLEQQIFENETKHLLGPTDVKNLVMNSLKHVIANEVDKGLLRGRSPRHGDLLMAGYLTGKIDGEVLSAMMDLEDLTEDYVPPMKRFVKIMTMIGKSALMINPYTGPYATIFFVLFDSIKQRDELYRSMADETHLIN